MLTTTFDNLITNNACEAGLATLRNYLGISVSNMMYNLDLEIPLETILESNGLEHAIWALRTQKSIYSIQCLALFAKKDLHNLEKEYPDYPNLEIYKNILDIIIEWTNNPSDQNKKEKMRWKAFHAYRNLTVTGPIMLHKTIRAIPNSENAHWIVTGVYSFKHGMVENDMKKAYLEVIRGN